MSRKFAAVIMAAGKSTRMRSARPKTVHEICGKPMARHVVDACTAAGISPVIVIVGYEAEKVKRSIGSDVQYAYQMEQLGTGHACMQAMPVVPEDVTDVVVLPGDAPLITPEELKALIECHQAEENAATLLTATLDDPAQYGRIVRAPEGSVVRIVEAKDADQSTLKINEINTSIYCFQKVPLVENLGKLSTDNVQGEYYLTDVIGLLRFKGARVGAIIANDAQNTLGINNRVELANAAAVMRRRILENLMLSGVTIVDPATTYIDVDVEIGADSTIHPCTVIEKGSRIGSNCSIGPFAHLRGVTISDNTGGEVDNG